MHNTQILMIMILNYQKIRLKSVTLNNSIDDFVITTWAKVVSIYCSKNHLQIGKYLGNMNMIETYFHLYLWLLNGASTIKYIFGLKMFQWCCLEIIKPWWNQVSIPLYIFSYSSWPCHHFLWNIFQVATK